MRPFDNSAESVSVVGSRRQLAGPAHGRQLHRIAQVLEQEGIEVRSAADILNEPETPPAPGAAWRGRLANAMRTVRSIQLLVDDEEVQSLTIMLIQQLTDMNSELPDVAPGPSKGRQRTNDERGAMVENQLPRDVFDRPGDV